MARHVPTVDSITHANTKNPVSRRQMLGVSLASLAVAAVPSLFSTRAWAAAVLDAVKAAKLIQERQQLEVNLAWQLLEVFNKTPELIQPLRDCVDLALQEMICIRDGIDPAGVQAAIDEEKGIMSLLRKQRLGDATKLTDSGKAAPFSIDKAAQLEVILKEVPTMDAQEISDLIRLYGTFVEKASGLKADQLSKEKIDELLKKGDEKSKLQAFYAQVYQKKEAYRKGTEKLDTKDVWNQGKAGEELGRHRQALLSNELKDKLKKLEVAKAPPNEILDAKIKFLAEAGYDYEKTSRGGVQHFLVSMQGGQSIFALKDSSTVGKIDRAFGLVPAADISGTTADTIFFLSKFPGIDPIYQILPIASIVAGAHHSLLEVALPLSQNKIIDYDIGFYTSLLPAQSKHSAKDAVLKVLKLAENEALNHHLLVYYAKDGKAVEGAYEFVAKDAKSFEAYRKFAKATHAMEVLAKTSSLDKATVDGLVKTHGLDAK